MSREVDTPIVEVVVKRLGIGLLVLTLIVGVLFVVWPSVQTEPVPKDRAAVRKQFTKKLKIKPLQPVQKRAVAPAPLPSNTPARMKPPKATMKVRRPVSSHGSIDDQVHAVLSEPLDPPTHIKDDEVAANRGVWRRNRRLDELADSLVGQLKESSDPHTKLEIHVALAEIYSEQVETLALYEAPSAWGEERTLRWYENVENQISTAEDKAAMLLRISEQEAGGWPDDDPAVQKLRQLH